MKINSKKIFFICGVILTFILFGIKCLISTKGATDEAYYIATAFRFYKGDAMLVDDWNAGQMSGFLLLPFVYLYMLFAKTTEGIILYFRFLYLLFKVFTAAFCLVKLKKYKAFGVVGVSVYYLFSPQTLDSLSYNTISIGMILMIGAVYLSDNRRKLDYYLCGIFLAVAVLAQPFCILIYFAGAAVVIGKVMEQKSEDRWAVMRKYAIVSAGAVTILVIFLTFVFSRASWKEIVSNLPFILQDPNHNVTGVSGLVSFLLKPVKVGYYLLRDYTVVTIMNMAFFFLVLIMKQHKRHLIYGALLCLTLSFVVIMKNGWAGHYIENEFFIPFVWFSLEEILLINKEKKKNYYAWGLFTLFILCVCLSTDTGIISTSAAMCPIAVFSILMLPDLMEEDGRKAVRKKYYYAVSIGISVCVFAMRLLCTWTDTLMTMEYSHYIEKGPLKGTYTDKEWFEKFNNIMSDLDMIPYTEDDILFCGRNTPLAYLYSSMDCGAMSTYLLETDYERLEQYYSLHPHKFPTVVYYYAVGSYPIADKDTNSRFFGYIEANYDVHEIDGRFLAVAVKAQ